MAYNIPKLAQKVLVHDEKPFGERRHVWSFTLPTNPGFREPNVVDCERGINPQDIDEIAAAGRAIVYRLSSELGRRFTPREWVQEQARRLGNGNESKGRARLTLELLNDVERPGVKKTKRYKALIRALQRIAKPPQTARPGSRGGIHAKRTTHESFSAEHQQLIRNATFVGAEDGNPFSANYRPVLDNVDGLIFAATGDWRISQRVYECARKQTPVADFDRDRNGPFQAEIIRGGASLLDTLMHEMADSYGRTLGGALHVPGEVILEWLHALHVLVDVRK